MRVLPCSSRCFSARCTALSDGGRCSAVWAKSSMDLSSSQVCAWGCEPCLACALCAISLHGRGTRIDGKIDGKMVMAMLFIMPQPTGKPAHGRLDTLAHPWASVCHYRPALCWAAGVRGPRAPPRRRVRLLRPRVWPGRLRL